MTLVCNCTLPPSACRTCNNFIQYYGKPAINIQREEWIMPNGETWIAKDRLDALQAEVDQLRRELAEIKANPFKPIQEMGYHDVEQYYVDELQAQSVPATVTGGTAEHLR